MASPTQSLQNLWDDDDDISSSGSASEEQPNAGRQPEQEAEEEEEDQFESERKRLCKDSNLTRSFLLTSCRAVNNFEKLNKIDEGGYGAVYRARDRLTGEEVALKKVKFHDWSAGEGFPVTALREVHLLLSLHHENVVTVLEMVIGDSINDIFMVMQYMEHDLRSLTETLKYRFTIPQVKCLMLQLLEAINYLHKNWVLHRDLKTSNILLNNDGQLRLCDFGMARNFGAPLKKYTPCNQCITLPYRSPEGLLGAPKYSSEVDMWGVGTVFAELLTNNILFRPKDEIDMVEKIFQLLGTPTDDTWPGWTNLPFAKNFANCKKYKPKLHELFPKSGSHGDQVSLTDAGYDLLARLLSLDPCKRISAQHALDHAWFTEEPLATPKDKMPKFKACHDKPKGWQAAEAKKAERLKAEKHKEHLKRKAEAAAVAAAAAATTAPPVSTSTTGPSVSQPNSSGTSPSTFPSVSAASPATANPSLATSSSSASSSSRSSSSHHQHRHHHRSSEGGSGNHHTHHRSSHRDRDYDRDRGDRGDRENRDRDRDRDEGRERDRRERESSRDTKRPRK